MNTPDKLRRWAAIAERQRSGAAPVDYVLLRTAADEIERLEAENIYLRQVANERICPECQREEAAEAAERSGGP